MPHARATTVQSKSVASTSGLKPETALKFPLTAQGCTEICNALTDDHGVAAKLEEETTAHNDLDLTQAEWTEIYQTVREKYSRAKRGFYGSDRTAKDWRQHLNEILEMLEPVRAQHIGGRAIRASA